MILRITCAVIASMWLISDAVAGPETVYFRSADGTTKLVGYLFRPKAAGPWPAIVMLHGRGGPYSSNVNDDCTLVAPGAASPCNATTLSRRHAMWGQYWADRGYLALLPDSFGPRGKAHGFGRFTHDDPERADVNEKTVRPLDAEGALAYLHGRNDVIGSQIFLQGWSNGGSTALNVMIRQGTKPASYGGALVLYPGCGPAALLQPVIPATAPIALFLGTHDEEVSPLICQQVADRSRRAGARIDLSAYPGATHDFDDPSPRHRSVPGNQAAMNDVLEKAIALVARWKNSGG
ncbi:dienelactone hydrolase family protein [Bradyrhizobium neotropicale]|nr:dienelactone hydrolase family protein [Bradyrhizobium neotropicale]